MPRAEHRRRSSAIGDANRPERAKPQAERMRRPELWAGRPSLLRRSGVRASQVAPLRTTFATFLHGATYGLVWLSACRNAASRNTPQVGAPFITPAARQNETSDGTDATARALGRATVFVTPFQRAGVTSGAPTYHVCSFSAWCDIRPCRAFGLLQRRFP